VHALGQVASFFTESGMTVREYQLALNALMPFDIRVLRARDASHTFHPRFSAIRRWYRYLVYNGDTLMPFFRNYALWLARGVNMDLLGRYAQRIVGRHDFTSFASLEPEDDPVREVYSFEVAKKNDFIIFDITANGFLRKMVRTLVGTFFEREKQGAGADTISGILRAKDRGEAGSTVYPGGLYLMKVFYESEFLR
jgi:tRNA pseudouridine38-40 synthase